ncbi:MAG: hypothetical protein Q4B82_05605 [Alysiella sp.]|uniref:hypothetical protein n=1 Tax=Alysiella sp. TaxID=1872483 RepID=UPI0026DAEFAA|nr:hypothetical protein [Alysiella sp.]MDO4434041.1 hypothetical protein [Alysiella sp.]
MTPEQLQSWQPQVSLSCLQIFINENRTLITLLEEAWQKFAVEQGLHEIQLPESDYGAGVSVDDLQHFPVSDAELSEFLLRFEQNNPRHDRPLGDNPEITEQNWTLSD